MGVERPFAREILVVGVLSTPRSPLDAAIRELTGRLGKVRLRTEPEPFAWTAYYDAEMGGGIERRYLEFEDFADPGDLAEIKRFTDEVESKFAPGGSRTINFDPGMLGLGRFCLATTKDRAHRIPLSGGIYAELTLIYEKGEFKPLPWTYPDWASPPVRALLANLRKRLFEKAPCQR